MTLKERFLKIEPTTKPRKSNPLLNFFEQDDLELLDEKANYDTFIAKKKKKILNLTKDLKIGFDEKLKSTYDEYSEALTYLRLKTKFDNVSRVPEGKDKTPDFKIEFTNNNNGTIKNYTVYAELKSMAFADGNQNYKDAMKQELDALNDIEEQIKGGSKVGIGISVIQPLRKSNKKYDPFSPKNAIETLIEKIDNNFDKGQFSMGETVLIVDLKQLALSSSYIESGVPVFQEKQNGSNVSGVQWHTAFGKAGHIIYKPIDFDGADNIDGELEKDGILINNDKIKAIIFMDFFLMARVPKIVGLYRQKSISDAILSFLCRFCDFVNNDKNSNGCRLYQEE